ncbi:GAF domain-containing sensor histidine kinase [Dermatobacter hominis]|uniref:GAF domain-containing sensor histidine kinase n=1 Tax=Dermatobacter hominis TaxID=2884263 RepID=UPI001D0FBD98|nr:GAF domain-containing sensor histidine kinase [Dermatobacter hominis]UDY34199.1 sensor histidine kinase [Dermatobacter hominis]
MSTADVSEAVAAFRALPHGGLDDSTRLLGLPPSWRASVSPSIAVVRWCALGYGLVFSAPDAFRGSYSAVVATAICCFVTTWRTVLPLQLGSVRAVRRIEPLVDVVAFGIAMGIAGGWASPYYFCLLISVAVVALGWGGGSGAIALVVGVAAVATTVAIDGSSLVDMVEDQRDVAAVVTLALAAAVGAYARTRIKEAERRRAGLIGEVHHLSETNELLEMLNVVARTLPDSLSLREALERIRQQLSDSFDARVICLMTFDDSAEEWVPKIADGCALRPAYPTSDLPVPLGLALAQDGVLRVDDLDPDAPGPGAPSPEGSTGPHGTRPIVRSSRSGMYVRLTARNQVIGMLGLEHPSPGRYDPHDAILLSGLGEVLALTVDNARWFGRLRTLGAQEERIRIARDLHDRLGQWLTYVSMELERIVAEDEPVTADLFRLQSDVQSALDELRETLRQLRSGVTDQKPLAVVAQDVVNRFAERADVATTLTVVHPDDRVPVPVENELLRILQEALTNVDRHADADHVDVVWDVRGGEFELVIADDGRGFESAKGVRDSAYGLVGMRERADVIGARLLIDSSPGAGTTVRVLAGPDQSPRDDARRGDGGRAPGRTPSRTDKDDIDDNREVAS